MKKRLIFLAFMAFIFSGCQEIKSSSAQVIDSEVEGLEYQCAGLIEYTDTNGTLYCNHFPVAFKIGEIKLGVIYKIPEDGIILPQDIVKVPRDNLTNKDVLKITTILQSLDADKNPENGITITKETRDKLSDIMIDIKKESLDNIKELIKSEIEDINFTDANRTILHLNRTMKRFHIAR
jgi:hypothetical protein